MVPHPGFHSPTAEKMGETKQHTCYQLCRLIPDCKIADYKSSSHECFLGNKLEKKADKQYIQYTKSCTCEYNGFTACSGCVRVGLCFLLRSGSRIVYLFITDNN